MKIFFSIIFLFLSISHSYAFYAVCGNANDGIAPTDGFRTERQNLDPSQKPADCYLVPEPQVSAQKTLVRSTDFRKLKIDTVNNIAILKSPASQAAIDAADQAVITKRQGYVTEQQTDNICSETDLNVINTKIDTLMASVTDIASAKSAMTVAVKKLARCLVSLRELAR